MTWPASFTAKHVPALSFDEVQYGVILYIMTQPGDGETWDFTDPGRCAIMGDRKTIVLGNVNEDDACFIAENTLGDAYDGVIGTGLTAHWFACRASELGIRFIDAEPQQIMALFEQPQRPPVPGYARKVTIDYIEIFTKWITDFYSTSAPFSDTPSPEAILRMASSGNYFFWFDNDNIVSMAGIARQLTNTAAVTGVYTPYELRGRGYAAAITSAVAELILADNRTPTLYTDLRVPASNRCYRRIGFRHAYTAMHFHRVS